MTELVERYVHQVGRYLPPKERPEIEAELRSMIQDQLDDRYEGAPSQAEVAAVLAELGDPRRMAVSYSSDKYLVGPALYPFMMMVLRHGWLIVPGVVVFLNGFGALISSQPTNVVNLFIETLFAVVQATLIFSAIVILFFAVLQHSGVEQDAPAQAFNPLDLPEVDDPTLVDRFESVFGIAFGTFITLVLIYFLRVGGLTLRFDLNDPGEVIPVSPVWLTFLIIIAATIIILHLLLLRRNRWNIGLWLVETLLEAFGVVCLYFVIYRPLTERILIAVPTLANVPFIDKTPEIIAVATAISTLVTRGSKLVKLWNYRNSSTSPFTIQTNG